MRLEPALAHIRPRLTGATYTAEDESGDANLFARELVTLCQAEGVKFLMSHTVTALRESGGKLDHVEATDSTGRFQRIRGDAYVMCMGSFSPLYLSPLGIRLPIYPAKGYSVTMPVKDAAMAHRVSLTDDEYKLVFSRLGERLRPRPQPRALRGDRPARGGTVPRRRGHQRGAVLDRVAARHAVQRAGHRPLEDAEPLPQYRARHAGLDACVRLGKVDRADRQRAGAGD